MQHLLVKTSRPAHLKASDWKVNGAGHKGACGYSWWAGRYALVSLEEAQITVTVVIDCVLQEFNMLSNDLRTVSQSTQWHEGTASVSQSPGP